MSDAPRTQDAPDARDARLPRWQRVPLRTTLALAVSAIAAVVLLIIGVASVLGLRASVLAQLDAELARELSTPIAAWDDATGGRRRRPARPPAPHRSRTRHGRDSSSTGPGRAGSPSPRSSSTGMSSPVQSTAGEKNPPRPG